jgi:hypothetical protein
MGREMASAFARWCALTVVTVQPNLVAVADLNPATLEWFKIIPTATQFTTDYHELLANSEVEGVYVAVPHHLHEIRYCDVLAAGKDLFAEKPFGIDLASAYGICSVVKCSGRFVGCSSEMPFFSGAQRAIAPVRSGKMGRVFEVVSGFHHSTIWTPPNKRTGNGSVHPAVKSVSWAISACTPATFHCDLAGNISDFLPCCRKVLTTTQQRWRHDRLRYMGIRPHPLMGEHQRTGSTLGLKIKRLALGET